MSGIYIPGMEMPPSCYDCDFAYQDQDSEHNVYWTCAAVHKAACIYERRDDCPLVPVPEHGRLIEDTAVQEQIDKWLDSVGDVVVGHGLSYYGELLGCIKDAPTIISADKEG